MTLREYLKQVKIAAMEPYPWIFPYAAGVAAGVLSVGVSYKIKGLIPIHKDLIYVPIGIAEHMNNMNTEVVATVVNSPWNVDLLLKLVPRV